MASDPIVNSDDADTLSRVVVPSGASPGKRPVERREVVENTRQWSGYRVWYHEREVFSYSAPHSAHTSTRDMSHLMAQRSMWTFDALICDI